MIPDTLPPSPEPRLETWKAIAAYLQRDVRTVVRWEKSEGLPVHRHLHQRRHSVYAFPNELDAWRAARSPRAAATGTRSSPPWLRVGLAVLMAAIAARDGHVPAPASIESGPVDHRLEWPGDTDDLDDTRISPDGQWISYRPRQPARPILTVRHTVTGVTRTLVPHAFSPAFSPDGQFVAFVTDRDDRAPTRIHVARLDTPDRSTDRVVFEGADCTIAQWSSDGRQLLIVKAQGDQRVAIGLVDVRDGRWHALASVEEVGDNVRLSPDNAYVAYDRPASQTAWQADVFVVSARDGHEQLVLGGPSSDTMIGWSPDGKHLVFRSDRRGTSDIWAQPVHGATPVGEPRRVAAEFTGVPRDLRSDGALLYQRAVDGTPPTALVVASLDANGAMARTSWFAAHDRQAFSRFPRWSADGRQFRYVTSRVDDVVLATRTVSTRHVTEVPLNFQYIWTFDWAPEADTVVFRAINRRGDWGIFVFEPLAGRTQTLALDNGAVKYSHPQFTSDGRAVAAFKLRVDGGHVVGGAYVEWDIASRHERMRHSNLDGFLAGRRPLGRSPDGRFLLAFPEEGRPTRLLAFDTTTGLTRELLRVDLTHAFNPDDGIQWLSDGRSLLANVSGTGKIARELWWVATDGRPPHQVRLDTALADSAIAVHPDSTQVAFLAGGPVWSSLPVHTNPASMAPGLEFRLLENFLPR